MAPEPKWARVSDVQDAWLGGELDLPEEKVLTWICKAERKLAREVPHLVDRIDSGNEPDLLETVRDVVAAMVERKMRNPEGYRQTMDVGGPITRQAMYGGDTPGELTITDDELASLAPPDTRGKAFSIDLHDPPAPPARGDVVSTRDGVPPLPPGVHPLTGARIN